jgi:hypothetical protein
MRRIRQRCRLKIGSRRRLAEIQHHAAVDLAGLHPVEDVVDLLQRCRTDFRVHLAVDGERDGFIEVAARADDGAAHGDPLKHHVGNSPGGTPTRLTVPFRRTIFSANSTRRRLATHNCCCLFQWNAFLELFWRRAGLSPGQSFSFYRAAGEGRL